MPIAAALMRWTLVFWALGYGLAAFAAEDPLKLGVLANRPKPLMAQQYQPLAQYLSNQLGRDVELLVLTEKELQEAASSSLLDLVITNPSHFLQLRSESSMVRVLATVLSVEQGQPVASFGGVIVTREDRSDIRTLKDLSGQRIGTPGKGYLGGFQAPVLELLEAGHQFPRASRLVELNNSFDVLEALMDGRVDVGFIRTGVIERLATEGSLDPARLKVLNPQQFAGFPHRVSTRLYPEYPFVVLTSVDLPTIRKLFLALFSLDAAHPVTQAAGIGGFIPPADYTPVEELARRLRLPPYDQAPVFTLSDVWAQYQLTIVIAALALGAISLLTLLLARRHRESLVNIALLQRAQADLQTQEARFRKIFEHLPLPTGLLGHDGRIVALNARFEQLFGYTLADIPDFAAWKRQAYPDAAYGDQAVAQWQQAIELAASTGSDIVLPSYRITCKDGSQREILISGIPLAEGVLTTFLDITDRVKQEANLHRQVMYSAMMQRLSVSLINLPLTQLDCAIQQALAEVGHFFRVDRAYIFDYDWTDRTARNTFEWCAPGISAEIDHLQRLTVDIFPESEWINPHQRGEALNVPSVQALTPGPLLDILMAQGIQSLLTVPVMSHGQCLGFVGMDAVRQPSTFDETEREFLGLFAEILANIAERRKAEGALRLSASVFTHATEGIFITDPQAHIVDVNAAFTAITGYTREEVLGKNPRILNSDRQDKEFYAGMWQELKVRGQWYGEVWNRHKDGRVYAEMLTISSVTDEHGHLQNYIALFSDITPQKEHQAQLEHMAHYDVLTGLPNRLLLADRLKQGMRQAIRRGLRLAVVYLDLDGFKAINDTHGHDCGDQLLIALATRMSEALREGDTLTRIGGDEFVAVLVDLPDTESCTSVLQRLLLAASDPVHLGDLSLGVSASIGVSVYPQMDEVDADQLVRQADQAMYVAKQSGKNRYHLFDAQQDRDIRGRHEDLERIRQALERREFVLFYQPKVNMRTGAMVGAEALIRWQHPERGLLPPSAFLASIENHPLSVDLGEWVLEAALTQIEAWRAEGESIPVSVNIGALQLQDPRFVAVVRSLLAGHPGVRPGDLELEILETSALEDFTAISEAMAACQDLGVGFSIDDFGTGYSSLTYLKRLPAAVLKVDQSFVLGMLDDADDLAILKGVLGLAEAFNRQVIAEGVETPAHGEALLQLGCVFGQGYAIARPMPPRDLAAWAKDWVIPSGWCA